MDLKIIPITISVRTSTVVINKVVVWVCNPETSRSLISVKQRPTSLNFHNKVTLDEVLFFNSIFNEDYMTFDIKSDIVYKSHVMSSVQSESSVETLMCTKTFAVRFVNSTDHVEVNCISSNFESLADIS